MRGFLSLLGLLWIASLPFVQPAAPAPKVVAGKSDAKTAKVNRELIEAGLLGGGTVKLPAGEIHLDRSLLLGPQHSGGTLQGVGAQTILRNSHATGNGVNGTLSINGLGVAYMHGATVTPDGQAVILGETIPGTAIPWDNPGAQPELLVPGNVVYGFVYDSYLTTAPPLPRKRYVIHSFNPAARRLEFLGLPDPALPMLKWMDGTPTDDIAEGSRVVRSAALYGLNNDFVAGQYVFVTDGPSVANAARGEHRRVLAFDSAARTVTLDQPVSRAYTLPALARTNPVAGVTLSRLTLAQPAHPQANPFDAGYAVDLRLDRVRILTPDDAHATGAGFASCGRVTLTDCESYGMIGVNGCHDVLIDGGVLAAVYGEEASTNCTVRNATVRANPKQAGSPPNGIRWIVGSDRLKVERTRIEGFGIPHPAGGAAVPLIVEGRGLLLRDVTIANSPLAPGFGVSFLSSDGGVIDRLSSDLPVWLTGGKGWRIEDSAAPWWVPRPGSTGTMTATTPAPNPTPDWIIRP